jgi:hypothetical protein
MNEKRLTMNRNELAIYLGERTGADVRPCDVASCSSWIFLREEEYPKDAVCFDFARNNISMEPWTDIPIEKSPLGTKDKAVIDQTISKLNSEYRTYLREIDRHDLLPYFENKK